MGTRLVGAIAFGELSVGARVVLVGGAILLIGRSRELRLLVGLSLVLGSLLVAVVSLVTRPDELELVMDGAIVGSAVGAAMICAGTPQATARGASRRERARERSGAGWSSRR